MSFWANVKHVWNRLNNCEYDMAAHMRQSLPAPRLLPSVQIYASNLAGSPRYQSLEQIIHRDSPLIKKIGRGYFRSYLAPLHAKLGLCVNANDITRADKLLAALIDLRITIREQGEILELLRQAGPERDEVMVQTHTHEIAALQKAHDELFDECTELAITFAREKENRTLAAKRLAVQQERMKALKEAQSRHETSIKAARAAQDAGLHALAHERATKEIEKL